jgi:hypothetical protein
MGTDQAQAAVDFEQLLGDLSAAFVRYPLTRSTMK